MKKSILLLSILFMFLFSFFACQKMDHSYSKFIVPGGIIYPGRVDSPLVYAGHDRIKLSWHKNSDPSVVMARIFWNNYTDSTEVNLQHTAGDTVNVTIDNLSEKDYSFFIKTYDKEGRASVPLEVIASSYGEKYQKSLLERPLNSAVLYQEDSIFIKWGTANVSGGAIYTEVRFQNNQGKTITKRFPISQDNSIIGDIDADKGFSSRTLYIPDSLSIDTFYTDFVEHNKPYDAPPRLDMSDWEVVDYSSTRACCGQNWVGNVLDGDTTTRDRWVNAAGTKYPHWFVVDMKKEYTVTKFKIFDDPTSKARMATNFKLLISKDNEHWTDLGLYHYDMQKRGGQFFEVPSHKGRYFKFKGLSSTSGQTILFEAIFAYGLVLK